MGKIILKYCMILILVSFSLTSGCKGKEHDHASDVYTCVMHPQVRKDRPGDCPICGMKLILLEKQSSSNPTDFLLTEEKQALIGIRSETVTRGDISRSIKMSGRVAYDPELYSAFTEYREIIGNPAFTEPLSASKMVSSLKSRLIQLGLSSEQIRHFARKDPNIFLTGRSGAKSLVFAQVYEQDISSTVAGLTVNVLAESYPDRSFRGNIQSIDNLLDEKNRTLRVWCEVDDPANLLKPQMFVDVTAKVVKKNVIRISRDSILPTGIRQIVYLKLADNKFKPIEVKTGILSEEWIEVTDGLSEGEEVVVGANFLLDSEAKLKLGNAFGKENKGENRGTHNH